MSAVMAKFALPAITITLVLLYSFTDGYSLQLDNDHKTDGDIGYDGDNTFHKQQLNQTTRKREGYVLLLQYIKEKQIRKRRSALREWRHSKHRNKKGPRRQKNRGVGYKMSRLRQLRHKIRRFGRRMDEDTVTVACKRVIIYSAIGLICLFF